jgi:hypothetical protein
LLAGVIKLESAEPAMIQFSSRYSLEEVKESFTHTVDAVPAL